MHSEDLILFREDRDEAIQILIRKKYVELHNSQTDLTTCLFVHFLLHICSKKKKKGRDIGFTR